MSLSTTKLIEHWQTVRQAETKKTARKPSFYLRELVIASISHTEQTVYRGLLEQGAMSSADVAAQFSLSLAHALNVLNHLHQYGLVTRRANREHNRPKYLWAVAEGPEAVR